MEQDLQRYYKSVTWRSHIFALSHMMARTDIHPFAIMMPKPVNDHETKVKENKSDFSTFGTLFYENDR